MIDYVTKQRKDYQKKDWKIYSNFDWETHLENLKKILENNNNMKFFTTDKNGEIKNESRLDNLEYQFTSWLRIQIIETTKSSDEIKNEIIHNEDLFHIYSKRKNTYDQILTEFVKIRNTEKPKPDWEKKIYYTKNFKRFY